MIKILICCFILLNIIAAKRNLNVEGKLILLGKYDPSKIESFVLIGPPYTYKNNVWLHKEVFDAFKHMYHAAKSDGIDLFIISGVRTFWQQKQIWENKWQSQDFLSNATNNTTEDNIKRALLILRYTAMPGTSRHHWGTDIDLNSISIKYFQTEKGKKVYEWLAKNAQKYGFCQPYFGKGISRMTGHEDEPWHWSYVPLSSKYCIMFSELITYDDIKEFSGSDLAPVIDVFKNYVFSVNKECNCKSK